MSDGKYTKDYDTILEAEDVEIKRVGQRMHKMNAFTERFVQCIKQ
jgi:putative transposase